LQITKPRTQRKKMFQAPAHSRYKYFSAHLSSDLKKKHSTNAVPVRMGDTVRIMRGDRKGFEGKVTKVERKGFRIFVEGVTREKVDGTSIPIPIHPSKVMIINLNLEDKWRREALKRKGMPIEKAAPPTVEAVVEKKEKDVEEKPKAKKAAKKPRKKKTKEEPAEAAPEKEKITRKAKKLTRKRTRTAKAEKGAE